MSAVLLWIQQNPSAVKAYLVSVLALVAKGVLASTGKIADLGQWSSFVDQAIDLLVGALTVWGFIAGSIHVSRGPLLTSTAHAAVIIAALAPVSPARAVETVKAIAPQTEATK